MNHPVIGQAGSYATSKNAFSICDHKHILDYWPSGRLLWKCHSRPLISAQFTMRKLSQTTSVFGTLLLCEETRTGLPFLFCHLSQTTLCKEEKKKKKNKAVRHPRGSAERQLSKVFLIRICSEAEEEERERGGGSGVRTGSLSLDCSLPDTLIC